MFSSKDNKVAPDHAESSGSSRLSFKTIQRIISATLKMLPQDQEHISFEIGSKDHPNHPLDCLLNQIAEALYNAHIHQNQDEDQKSYWQAFKDTTRQILGINPNSSSHNEAKSKKKRKKIIKEYVRILKTDYAIIWQDLEARRKIHVEEENKSAGRFDSVWRKKIDWNEFYRSFLTQALMNMLTYRSESEVAETHRYLQEHPKKEAPIFNENKYLVRSKPRAPQTVEASSIHQYEKKLKDGKSVTRESIYKATIERSSNDAMYSKAVDRYRNVDLPEYQKAESQYATYSYEKSKHEKAVAGINQLNQEHDRRAASLLAHDFMTKDDLNEKIHGKPSRKISPSSSHTNSLRSSASTTPAMSDTSDSENEYMPITRPRSESTDSEHALDSVSSLRVKRKIKREERKYPPTRSLASHQFANLDDLISHDADLALKTHKKKSAPSKSSE